MKLVFSVENKLFRIALRADLQIIAGTFSGSSFPVGFCEARLGKEAFLIRNVGNLQGQEVFLLFALPEYAGKWVGKLREAAVVIRDWVFNGAEVCVRRDTLNGVVTVIPEEMRFYEYCQQRFVNFVDNECEAWKAFTQQRSAAMDQEPVPAARAPRRQLTLIPTPAIVVERAIEVPRPPIVPLSSYDEFARKFPLLVEPDVWPFTFQLMYEAGENLRYCLALSMYLRGSVNPEQLEILEGWKNQGQLSLFLDSYASICGF